MYEIPSNLEAPRPKRESELAPRTSRGKGMLQILLAMTTLAYGAVHSHDIQAKEPSRETSSEQAHPDMATYQAGLEARLESKELIAEKIPDNKLPPVHLNVFSMADDTSVSISSFMDLLENNGFDIKNKKSLTKFNEETGISWDVRYVEKSSGKVISSAESVTYVYVNETSFNVELVNSDDTKQVISVDLKTGKFGSIQNSWTQ